MTKDVTLPVPDLEKSQQSGPMRFVETEIAINASPEVVWALLTSAERLQQGYGIVKIDGRIGPGEKLRLWSEVAPSRAFDLTVAEFDPPFGMVWRGGMPFGLFTGRRTYALTPGRNGETRFSMREEFTGLFAPMIFSSMPDLNPGFRQFAAKLKKDAEA
jgi:hypothetical protein